MDEADERYRKDNRDERYRKARLAANRDTEKAERKAAELVTKDRIENPHLALISDHLWWLALMVKITLFFMLISIIAMFLMLSQVLLD